LKSLYGRYLLIPIVETTGVAFGPLGNI